MAKNKTTRLKILSKFRSDDGNHYYYNCLCECGQIKAIRKDSVDSNTVISCGCYHKKVCGNNSKKLAIGEACFNGYFYTYKKDAQKRGLSFLLSKDQFREIVTLNCFYCGDSPKEISKRNKRYNGSLACNGVDRKNNLIGYTLKNCVSCCSFCNYAKKQLSIHDFIVKISKVYWHSIGSVRKNKQ